MVDEGGDSTKIIRFTAQLITGRWFMLFASFIIMAGSGSTYVFGIYSKDIKKSLGYDQTTLNLLGFFKDLGTTVGILSGLLAEITPAWFSLLVGASMNFAGYFSLWLAVTSRIPKPRIWQMCLFISIGANSQNFANTIVLTTCVKNFLIGRGVLIGLLKGCCGLSGAIMTQLYLAIYGNDSKSLILLISWLPVVALILFVYTIREIKAVRRPNDQRALHSYLLISVVLALFIMVITIIQKHKTFSHGGYIVSATSVCFLLFLPLAVSIKEELSIWNQKTQTLKYPTTIIVDSSRPPVAGSISPALPTTEVVECKNPETSGCFSDVFNPPKRGEDYTILQAIMSIDMFLLLIMTFTGLGTSLTAIDNLGQIGESQGYPNLAISSSLSLISIWNFFGRVGIGFASEWLVTKCRFPRTLVMTIFLFFSCIGHILIAFPFMGSLYISSVIIGFSYGAQVAMNYTIISEIFGLKYFSTLCNWSIMAMSLGSYVFNVRIAGKLYDKEALRQLSVKGLKREIGQELTCIGTQCYRLCFIILAASTFIGLLSSLVLAMRTYKFYQGDIYKKFGEVEGEETVAKTEETRNTALSKDVSNECKTSDQ